MKTSDDRSGTYYMQNKATKSLNSRDLTLNYFFCLFYEMTDEGKYSLERSVARHKLYWHSDFKLPFIQDILK